MPFKSLLNCAILRYFFYLNFTVELLTNLPNAPHPQLSYSSMCQNKECLKCLKECTTSHLSHTSTLALAPQRCSVTTDWHKHLNCTLLSRMSVSQEDLCKLQQEGFMWFKWSSVSQKLNVVRCSYLIVNV